MSTQSHSTIGKDGRQKENGAAEDEMVRSHHWLSGQESERTLGESGGQRSLASRSPRGHRAGPALATEQEQSHSLEHLSQTEHQTNRPEGTVQKMDWGLYICDRIQCKISDPAQNPTPCLASVG